MEYRSLGRTGVQVSAACYGTMTFGWEPEDWGSFEQTSIELAHKALDLGLNFFDTADVYARGESERILGKALALRQARDRIVLATKCHGKMSDTDPNAWGNSARHVIEACEASLKRLGTDYIDLYQIHRPQPSIPIDETLRGLDQLVRSGKVRYIGCSTFAAWQVCEAHYVAKSVGTSTFVTEQPPYNLLDRRIERELLPFCRTYGLGVIPWSPLAGGMLSGKYLDQKPEEGRYAKSDPGKRLEKLPVEKLHELDAVAKEAGMSMATLSLAWVANQPGITSPIIGARSATQLEESVAACQVKLDADLMMKIDAIFAPGTHHIDYYSANFGPGVKP
jgi:aryl-alcohol dehydrogenase-like predicted oxidoreductase